jgi:hypothetical protein
LFPHATRLCYAGAGTCCLPSIFIHHLDLYRTTGQALLFRRLCRGIAGRNRSWVARLASSGPMFLFPKRGSFGEKTNRRGEKGLCIGRTQISPSTPQSTSSTSRPGNAGSVLDSGETDEHLEKDRSVCAYENKRPKVCRRAVVPQTSRRYQRQHRLLWLLVCIPCALL